MVVEPKTRAQIVPLTLRVGETEYAVERLRPDPAVARAAFRLRKRGGDEAVYDVHVDRYGPQCDCLGFLRWNKPCKHIRVLRVAGLI